MHSFAQGQFHDCGGTRATQSAKGRSAMKVCIRARCLQEFGDIESFAIRRAQFQLSRYGHELKTVVIRLSDENGPRGGIDKKCQVTLTSRRFGTVSVQEMDADVHVAVNTSIERASRAMARMLERAKNHRLPIRQRWLIEPRADYRFNRSIVAE